MTHTLDGIIVKVNGIQYEVHAGGELDDNLVIIASVAVRRVLERARDGKLDYQE